MTIHKEGIATISLTAVLVSLLNLANFSYIFPISVVAAWIVFIITVAFFLFIVSFFRMPNRNLTINDSAIIAPADGKVVVIEEVQPDEYYTEKRIQLLEERKLEIEQQIQRIKTGEDVKVFEEFEIVPRFNQLRRNLFGSLDRSALMAIPIPLKPRKAEAPILVIPNHNPGIAASV